MYEAVKASIAGNASYCLLTTDMWIGCHSYLYWAVTIYIVIDEWKITSFCLATCEISDVYTANNIWLLNCQLS